MCKTFKFQPRLNHSKLFIAPFHNRFPDRKKEVSFVTFSNHFHLSFSFPRINCPNKNIQTRQDLAIRVRVNTMCQTKKKKNPYQVDQDLAVTIKTYVKLCTSSNHI